MGRTVKRTAGEYGYNSRFPKTLRALMENKKNISPLNRSVTQAELAEHLGITRQAVSAYTLGTSVPDMLKFKDIADFFGVSYAFLLGTTNVIKEEHKSFPEKAGLSPQTLEAILRICESPRHAFAFMLLVQTMEFYDIINAIVSYLSISWNKTVSTDELLSIDAEVRRKSGGSLRAVPAALEKKYLIANAQDYLANAIKEVDRVSDPTGKTDDSYKWNNIKTSG